MISAGSILPQRRQAILTSAAQNLVLSNVFIVLTFYDIYIIIFLLFFHELFGKETHWSALLPMGGIAAP